MKNYGMFTAKEIKPQGWLRRQLLIQAKGLAGNLDKVWPDVRDSAWIGGNREGWERVPYWLDGFIPLAYLLDDDDMKARAGKYIDAILAQQKEDGWICPCKDEERAKYDLWALFLVSKVLTMWYDCTGDARIPEALYRAFKNFAALLDAKEYTIFNWGKQRWYEAFIALDRLYSIYPEEWIKSLAKTIREQGQDYKKLVGRWKTPLNKWTQGTHIVNLMMFLKFEAVSCDLLGEEYKNAAEEMYSILKKYNGTAAGLITGDECLSGLSPTRGTELCAVAEQMYSCELLYAKTGDARWAERLERAAFNGLPATITDDMWAHQYVQMSNQINCEKFPGKSHFRTNGPQAHIFGLEPNFGCCTANFGQAFPKLALSTFMRTDKGILSAVPIPSAVKTEIDGVPVTVTLKTEYPFENTFEYKITAKKPVKMRLSVRVPSFAEKLKVDGKPHAKCKMLEFDREWRGSTTVVISYKTTPHFFRTPCGLQAAENGSIVYSLPIKTEYVMKEYIANDVERKYPYCDYELKGGSPWQYAYADEKLTCEAREGDKYPFSSKHPRTVLKAKVYPIKWELEDGYERVCAVKPRSAKPTGKAERVELFPYACAKLRMTEMPFAKVGKK